MGDVSNCALLGVASYIYMKKLSSWKKYYLKRKQGTKRNRTLQFAGIQRNQVLRRRYKNAKIKREETSLQRQVRKYRKIRNNFQKLFYKKINYRRGQIKVVNVDEQVGLEFNFETFLKFAESFVEFNTEKLIFNFEKCKRIWPSTIILLCSLKKWVELTSDSRDRAMISSSDSSYPEVNSYLAQCGFYKYVGRDATNIPQHLVTGEMVRINGREESFSKITGEKKPSEISIKEQEIYSLLKKYSALTTDQLEDFDCNVIIEAFNNISEHGIACADKGWWAFAQHHPTTEIVSLCFADNGIGIKNSLNTGPQKDELRKKIKSDSDSDFIEYALQENTSGSLEASRIAERIINDRYERGSRRGNGLNRIKGTCAKHRIKFNIVSQNGFLSIDQNGNINKTTCNRKVFAGTLYHFEIPAKNNNGETNDENN